MLHNSDDFMEVLDRIAEALERQAENSDFMRKLYEDADKRAQEAAEQFAAMLASPGTNGAN